MKSKLFPASRATLLAAFTLAIPSLHAATLINVDLKAGRPAYNGTGILGSSTTWQEIAMPAGTNISVPVPVALVDTDGAGTGVSFTLGSARGRFDWGTPASINGSVGNLLADGVFLNPGNTGTITLSGFAPGQTIADLVFFTGSIAGSVATPTSATYTVNGSTSVGALADGSIQSPMRSGFEYVHFTNVVANPSGNVTMTWTGPDGNPIVSGFQVSFVPEPSAALLGGLGLLGLLRRRRQA